MTLGELLKAIDPIDGSELIQICKEGSWDEYDIFRADSALLEAFYDVKISSIAAIKKDVFRVSLSFYEKEIEKVLDR